MILESRLKRTVRERIPIKKLVKIFYVNVKGEVEDLGESKGALEEPKEGGFVKTTTGKNVSHFANGFTFFPGINFLSFNLNLMKTQILLLRE